MGDIAHFGEGSKECQPLESGTSSVLSPRWLASGRQMDQPLIHHCWPLAGFCEMSRWDEEKGKYFCDL